MKSSFLLLLALATLVVGGGCARIQGLHEASEKEECVKAMETALKNVFVRPEETFLVPAEVKEPFEPPENGYLITSVLVADPDGVVVLATVDLGDFPEVRIGSSVYVRKTTYKTGNPESEHVTFLIVGIREAQPGGIRESFADE